MKILWCTDIHATGKSPNSRIDNYPISIQEKMIEIGEIAKKESVNFIIIGGDLFHVPVVANAYAGEIAKIIRDWNTKVYVVPGNHDHSGYNISTLKHSTLGMFESTGVISILTRETPVVGRLGNKIIAMEAQEYCVGIDESPDNYNKRINADFNILFAHGMLVEKPILDSINHVVISDITNPANITFSGHEHCGYGIKKINNNIFINNGSIGRTDCGVAMKNHKPSVIILNIENINGNIEFSLNEIVLSSVKNFYEVFREVSDTTLKDSFVNFVNTIRTVDVKDVKQDNFFDKLKKENIITDTIYDNCKKYLDEAKIDLDSQMLKSSSKSNETIFITKVEIKNFLSHKDSVIEFDSGLNIILGENGCGKSSIFKAIQYVLFDIPKGTDFIRTGASSCEIKITFNNGNYIKKIRTKVKGTYFVFDGKTEEKYEGYANNLPKQIAETHQMPMVNLYKEKLTSLNYADQHDGLFLMSLSSSEKAEAIGIITGTDVIDEAINNVSADVRENKSRSKVLKGNIDKLVETETILLEKYKKIELLSNIINTKYESIQKLNRLKLAFDNFNYYNNLYFDTKSKTSDINIILNKINIDYDNYCKGVEMLSFYNIYINDINNIANIKNHRCNIDVLLNRVSIHSNELIDYNVLSYYKDFILLYNSVESIRDKIVDTEKYISFYNRLPTVDNIYNIYGDFIRITNDISTITNNNTSLSKSIESYEESLNDIKYKIDIVSNELSQLGVCPICNKVLDKDSIEHFINKGD